MQARALERVSLSPAKTLEVLEVKVEVKVDSPSCNGVEVCILERKKCAGIEGLKNDSGLIM